LRFAILGSGSRGNALVVRCRTTTVLVDCGFSIRDIERRLARCATTPADVSAIVLTHEHNDHASGAAAFARRHDIPLWLTPGTQRALGNGVERVPRLHHFSAGDRFAVGDIEFQPFAVPHDANEPCQFVFSNGARRLGLLTDIGHITDAVAAPLQGCDALILECNHDADMLANGTYPPSLKARIAGPHGHLDNDTSAALLASLDHRRLQHLVAAHLSESNNTPWLARSTLGSVWAGGAERVLVAGQETGLMWRELV